MKELKSIELQVYKRRIKFLTIFLVTFMLLSIIFLMAFLYVSNILANDMLYEPITTQCLNTLNDTLHSLVECEAKRMNVSESELWEYIKQ